ncbi:beta-ketoacyl synthase N-terminal-like domain-containing protein [Salegentibacter salegens]|uniref:3-oxoacyl-(Acyl-carrier-protein) synthase n=1 Tax=Salegentibacter salegens TaxID=143223 RepID=A0A1M7MT42_9FLAO|nr:beta-ketoacyl synthase N-terminal-like domain-containing protein [Salegentibacter salegens]PRX52533.1 3-oxoacyl-(acyl-carrier-protein) synthase [Salegentibacter salegens]SHM94175.1 3-oxoacyl-(acyl-carrier-protein) synthase [Salegentibacter salegens]
MKSPVFISSLSSISALGQSPAEIWNNYKNPKHFITKHQFDETEAFAAFLPKEVRNAIEALKNENTNYRKLDDSVLFAIFSARKSIKEAGWENKRNVGINIGSSRGATGLFEKYHKEFVETGKAATQASPSTTLGNISSWVSQDLQTEGPEFSHSVTCSTGLHSVINAIAWMQAGFADKFLAGGSEAALTPFTIAQMKAMKIYASEDLDFPCRALDMEKKRNSMILGEASGILALQHENSERAIAKISGIGYATETLKHSVSISENGESLQKAMKMAIGKKELSEIDAVVMHAPGTLKGDLSEVNAIKTVFGKNTPAMTSNKWKLGHTFAASGILNLELAVLMLQHQEFIEVPFLEISKSPLKLENILVNAVGFGGNAVSILVTRK